MLANTRVINMLANTRVINMLANTRVINMLANTRVINMLANTRVVVKKMLQGVDNRSFSQRHRRKKTTGVT